MFSLSKTDISIFSSNSMCWEKDNLPFYIVCELHCVDCQNPNCQLTELLVCIQVGSNSFERIRHVKLHYYYTLQADLTSSDEYCPGKPSHVTQLLYIT